MTDKNKRKVKKQVKKQEQINPIKLDIMSLIFIGVSILLFLSAIGLCGIIGQGLSFVLFGMFGTAAYGFPFVFFFVSVFSLANKDNSIFTRKLVGLTGLFVLVCGLFQLVMIGYAQGYTVFQCFTDSAADKLGGGFLGGCIAQLFGTLIGTVGSYIVIIIGIIIFMIILTQKPLYTALRNNTKKAYTHAVDTRAVRREAKRALNETENEYDDETEAKPNPDEMLKPNNNIFDDYISGKSRGGKKETKSDDEMDSLVNTQTEDSFNEPAEVIAEAAVVDSMLENDAPDKPARNTHAKNESTQKAANDSDENEYSAEMNKMVSDYKIPPLSLLKKGRGMSTKELTSQVRETAKKLQQTLHSFGVEAKVINASCGPTVTRYELQPEQGVKVSKIVGLTDDIKLNLAASDIRIEAPIPGKAAIGIEVPNKTNNAVLLRELIDTDEFRNSKSKLSFAVGKDLAGKPVIANIATMPHLLIAGATGSGKSVCINTLIMSILYKASPDEVKFIMIDPKVVELSVYNGIPHLLSPVVTDPKKAAGALAWAVAEMTRRYNLFAEFGVRDLNGYNMKAQSLAHFANEEEEPPQILPQIVIVVDELADLMMVAPGEVEDAICRLAQLARAAGLHLIIATQRPSVNVITGLIKANMPSRIALSVTSGIDSRVILDMNGAEKLLGKGDMLFYPSGYPKPARVQGGYVSDEEIQKVVDFVSNEEPNYDSEVSEAINSSVSAAPSQGAQQSSDIDVYFADAGKFIIEKDKASIGMLQRVFKIGFNRAARIMDQLCDAGVVGEEEGTKPRKILMTYEQFENYLEENM